MSAVGIDATVPLAESYDLSRRAAELEVSLSPSEFRFLKDYAGREYGSGEGVLSRQEFFDMVRDESDAKAEKETLVSFIIKSHEHSIGQNSILACDYVATGLFATVGTIIAGQAGMNVVGTTFVGCVASLGGGTLNNVITGNTRGGVFWMRETAFLAVAFVCSVATFYLWPQYEKHVAKQFCDEMQRDFHSAGLEAGQSICAVSYEEFQSALERNPQLARRVLNACGPHFEANVGRSLLHEADGVRYLFEWLALGKQELGLPTLQQIARWEAMDSPVVYGLESIALGAVSVIGAQHGIVRGVRPLACIATGVTICFGGILRDLLCQRPVAIGGQSYALATAAGATVYVGLRQLVVAGYHVPLVIRIALAAGTAVAQRAASYYHNSHTSDKFLAPMANYHGSLGAAESRSGMSSKAEQLCDAASRGDVPALRQLVRHASVNPNEGDYDSRTALHLAASEGKWAAVKFLLEETGAIANPLDRWGGTPLDDAMRSKHALVANYLRSKGGLPGVDVRIEQEAKAVQAKLQHHESGVRRM